MSKYRVGVNGVFPTSALFQEVNMQRSIEDRPDIKPVFSLHEEKAGLINARRTFVELGDPTGYKWAMMYLDSWTHFQRLMKSPWFRKAFDEWNEELTAKRRAEALEVIRGIALEEGNKSALPAARYLESLHKTGIGRGRPTKAEITGELKKAVDQVSIENEDMDRIGLKLVGGKDANRS